MSPELTSTIVGLALGASIASIGFLAKAYLAQKAKLNEALFSLMELYRLLMLVMTLDIKRIISVVYEELEIQLPGQGGEQVANLYRPQINTMMAEIFTAQWDNFDKTIGETFAATCSKVASADPMLAARINGAQYLKGCLPAVQRYNESVRKMVLEEHSQTIVDEHDRIVATVQETINKKYITKLQKDLLSLAWKCGVVTYVRLLLKIRQHKKNPIQGQYEKMVRELIKKVVKSSARG